MPKHVWSVSTKTDAHDKWCVQERRVHFQEAPQIILFLSAPHDRQAEEVPCVRRLVTIVEEAERDGGNAEVAPVSPDPAPKDSCEGGLAELVADSWSEHG
ncbi:unnamed protein product, partial [Symbiodinium sp. KB8]